MKWWVVRVLPRGQRRVLPPRFNSREEAEAYAAKRAKNAWTAKYVVEEDWRLAPAIRAGDRTAVREMVLRRVQIVDGCWLWTYGLNRTGYAVMRFNGHIALMHRVIFKALSGPVADELELDHLCRRRSCVNPEHLEPVTGRENRRRGLGGVLKTNCVNGHPFDAENTYLWQGRRKCRACGRRNAEKYRARPLEQEPGTEEGTDE